MCARGETAVIIKNLTRRRNRLRRNKITAFSCHTVRLPLRISCQLAHCYAKCRTSMTYLLQQNIFFSPRQRTIQRIN
ncbi:hypothetical protein G7199_002735 [Salmonella enterica]|uniref:Periplasmic protein n=1 Tax=Salmonella enterica subsp. salamae serovar 50:b:z6 TaxID=1967621 RepID=A0A603BDA3_SALER|nr:hypothetical protein [Salmonella enterica]EAB9861037.1 hypothetical protein [Salmonella enterica subsp. salamae]MBA3001551.1 hypothetical protein [Salmonella enterica subsp. salamae serovar 3,10:b:e,n,x]HCM1963657.1 hypothetical protein [Salmonella enterica subsp. salamae serovar 56:l,v:z39]EAP7914716.1 hypothetical protein [Salmonella enterica]EBQ4853970.1 hypothetical protein [Salmonella enterica subsp. salamae]